MSEAFRLHFLPTRALRTGLRPAFRPLRAYLCHQSPAREIDVGQRERDEGAIGVLRQTAIAHLREAPQALDNSKHVLNPSADLRLVAILAARYLVNFARTARTLIGEVACLGGLAADQCFLARNRLRVSASCNSRIFRDIHERAKWAGPLRKMMAIKSYDDVLSLGMRT